MKRLIVPFVSLLLKKRFEPLPPSETARPDAPPYALIRQYDVGTSEFLIRDAERPLWGTIWYPAVHTGRKLAGYSTGPAHFKGRAVRDAPPEKMSMPYPLVIFSHGSTGSRFLYLYLVEHLAAHGFVVMAVDHIGNTFLDAILNPGTFEENRIRNFVYRPQDVLREITFAEELTAPNGKFAGLIDIERTAVVGHSFGGYTALAVGGARLDFRSLNAWCEDPQNAELDSRSQGSACYIRHHVEMLAEIRGLETIPEGLWEPITDSRIRALIAMSPWNAPIFGPQGLAPVAIPSLVMVGSHDPVTIPERDAYFAYRHLGSPQKGLATFQLGGHFLFVDECNEMMRTLGLFGACSDAVWDLERVHDIVNHLATAFLKTYLYEDADAAQALRAESVSFRGVTYQATW